MPARQPFTALCQAAAVRRLTGRADLHIHSTHSDGSYTPAQVVDLARRSSLAAVALTDHDSTAGVPEAQAAAAGTNLEIVPGVEISSEWEGRELHLLGYFVRLGDLALQNALERLRSDRAIRFHEMLERLRKVGVDLDEAGLDLSTRALGRRYLAEVLVQRQHAGSVRQAFARFLSDGGPVALPKVRLPVADSIALVRRAGGVASWAHPAYDCRRDSLARLCDLGLQALEVAYPSYRASLIQELRRLADEFGLCVTGGSDCHGPEPIGRGIGSCSITDSELAALRQRGAH